MDTALILRMKYDSGEHMEDSEITSLLEKSETVAKLTKDYEENSFFNLFRLICLAEIPFIERLPYTQKVLDYVTGHLAVEEGFSYTGETDYIVPCYNAMLLEAYTRLGRADSREVKNALEWVKRYQVFGRNQITTWKHGGICRHGGCMNSVPCYIGIGKTVRALLTYAEYTDHSDSEVEALIKNGTSYMLSHNMYQRLSNRAPISPHITDIMFPQAYMLSLTDLAYIAGKAELWTDPGTLALRELIDGKACGETGWKIDYIYSHKGYKGFSSRRKVSDWVGYIFKSYTDNCGKNGTGVVQENNIWEDK